MNKVFGKTDSGVFFQLEYSEKPLYILEKIRLIFDELKNQFFHFNVFIKCSMSCLQKLIEGANES